MKILFLVEDIKKVSSILRENNEYKVIDEYEMINNNKFTFGIDQPYYSDYIINRASTLSKIYNYNKPLCLVIDQRHKNTVDKIQHDVSIRVCKSLTPIRLSDSFIQSVTVTILENEFKINGLLAQLDRATAF